MSTARSPRPDPPRHAGEGREGARVHGFAEIGFAQRQGRTRLQHLYQHEPLRVLFPDPPEGELAQAVLATISGGLVGGDRLSIEVRLDAGARAHVTAAAAEKVYRSLGATAEVSQDLVVGAQAWLEFLPPETILFDGARLNRATCVELGPGAGFLGGGIIVFGRRARGEGYTRGCLREWWEVRCDGRLVWGDALVLDGDIAATISDPACFNNAAAFAGLILASPQDPRMLLEVARAVLGAAPAGVRGGVSALGPVLVARWLAADAATLRRSYADLYCHLRAAAMGLPPRLPRLWHV